MPHLNGLKVRHLAAELGLDIAGLAAKAGFNVRTMQNATRPTNPDGMLLPRVYAVARALTPPGQSVRLVAADIVADPDVAAEILATGDGVPDEPPVQPKPKTTSPPKRQDTERTKAPKRAGAAA